MLGRQAEHFLFQVADISSNQIILAIEGNYKMIDRLLKRLMKMFVPKPATLAKMASKQI